MIETTMHFSGYNIPLYSLNTVVVGTGAAGYNAADRLYGFGQTDLAIVTEHVMAGTSRNTGSDKQTYYKLTLSGGEPDSVESLARTLFDGQCVDWDHALAEAALSAPSFLRLADLGVPFPHNRYGEYVGYKTDHDPRRRATSAGPYTSKMMTECLQASVKQKNIPVFDHLLAVKIIVHEGKAAGLVCLNLNAKDKAHRYTAFNCKNIVYATGGPAGMYADSVFPFGHYGASGIAFEAGAAGKNLTEWQYGLASVKPRWNVSGTYMQSLPRFVSTDAAGGDEREFLFDFFTDKGELLTKVFLKGYQWPFDVRKIDGGSSIVDLLVYRETCLKGRRVFLDFRENPGREDVDFDSLSQEAGEYLRRAGADFGTPIQRLLHMNAPAVSFYQDKGVDLRQEPLEIALSAQHNNGGLAIDAWWQTRVEGLFCAGEAAGSHGVYRPGGSALNAGQAGSARAARYISARRQGEPLAAEVFEKAAAEALGGVTALAEAALGEALPKREDNVQFLWDQAAKRMSRIGAAIRDRAGIRAAIDEVREELAHFPETVGASEGSLHKLFRLRDALISQFVYLSAMEDYAAQGGKSRGSALYTDKQGQLPYTSLPELFRHTLDDGSRGDLVQEVEYKPEGCVFHWRKVRSPQPEDDFFENVWRSYRETGNID